MAAWDSKKNLLLGFSRRGRRENFRGAGIVLLRNAFPAGVKKNSQFFSFFSPKSVFVFIPVLKFAIPISFNILFFKA